MVVGAGLMGAGIAQWLSSRGIRVILKDVGPAPLGKGMQSIAKIYATASQTPFVFGNRCPERF